MTLNQHRIHLFGPIFGMPFISCVGGVLVTRFKSLCERKWIWTQHVCACAAHRSNWVTLLLLLSFFFFLLLSMILSIVFLIQFFKVNKLPALILNHSILCVATILGKLSRFTFFIKFSHQIGVCFLEFAQKSLLLVKFELEFSLRIFKCQNLIPQSGENFLLLSWFWCFGNLERLRSVVWLIIRCLVMLVVLNVWFQVFVLILLKGHFFLIFRPLIRVYSLSKLNNFAFQRSQLRNPRMSLLLLWIFGLGFISAHLFSIDTFKISKSIFTGLFSFLTNEILGLGLLNHLLQLLLVLILYLSCPKEGLHSWMYHIGFLLVWRSIGNIVWIVLLLKLVFLLGEVCLVLGPKIVCVVKLMLLIIVMICLKKLLFVVVELFIVGKIGGRLRIFLPILLILYLYLIVLVAIYQFHWSLLFCGLHFVTIIPLCRVVVVVVLTCDLLSIFAHIRLLIR